MLDNGGVGVYVDNAPFHIDTCRVSTNGRGGVYACLTKQAETPYRDSENDKACIVNSEINRNGNDGLHVFNWTRCDIYVESAQIIENKGCGAIMIKDVNVDSATG
jgi:hypothetical protein